MQYTILQFCVGEHVFPNKVEAIEQASSLYQEISPNVNGDVYAKFIDYNIDVTPDA